MPLHVSSTCAHHQEVKIALHSLWYHHTYRWPSRSQVVFYMFRTQGYIFRKTVTYKSYGFLHIRTVHLDIIKVLFIHRLMH